MILKGFGSSTCFSNPVSYCCGDQIMELVKMSLIVFEPATKQALAVRNRTINASDLLEAHFKQIDKYNPKINAVIW